MSRNYELLMSLGEKPLVLGEMPLTPPPTADAPRADRAVARVGVLRANASQEEIQLVQRLFLVPDADAPKSIVFCGIDEDKASAVLSARIGEILASDPTRQVCLVDANGYAPSVGRFYGIHAELDLADAVLEGGPIKSYAKHVNDSNLWLVAASQRIAERLTIWPPERLKERWGRLREEFDFVVTNAPAVHLHPDALALGRASDGVVLVLRENSTRREQALKVKESLETSGARLLGVVLADHMAPLPKLLEGIL